MGGAVPIFQGKRLTLQRVKALAQEAKTEPGCALRVVGAAASPYDGAVQAQGCTSRRSGEAKPERHCEHRCSTDGEAEAEGAELGRAEPLPSPGPQSPHRYEKHQTGPPGRLGTLLKASSRPKAGGCVLSRSPQTWPLTRISWELVVAPNAWLHPRESALGGPGTCVTNTHHDHLPHPHPELRHQPRLRIPVWDDFPGVRGNSVLCRPSPSSQLGQEVVLRGLVWGVGASQVASRGL